MKVMQQYVIKIPASKNYKLRFILRDFLRARDESIFRNSAAFNKRRVFQGYLSWTGDCWRSLSKSDAKKSDKEEVTIEEFILKFNNTWFKDL